MIIGAPRSPADPFSPTMDAGPSDAEVAANGYVWEPDGAALTTADVTWWRSLRGRMFAAVRCPRCEAVGIAFQATVPGMGFCVEWRRWARRRETWVDYGVREEQIIGDRYGCGYDGPVPVRQKKRSTTARKGIRPSVRFDVLQRDRFRCRYCGVGADAARLVMEHVKPVAAGGTNAPENLVAACEACNAGKGARSDTGAVLRLVK